MTDIDVDIARRVTVHLRPGEIVNLGVGIPTLVGNLLDPGAGIHLETENGLLGVGPAPTGNTSIDLNLVNAAKKPVTALPGASYFSSSASFALIRGGHVTTAVLGALQVDRWGRLANWMLPGRPILGVGGAMDLLVGARRVIVATTHTTRSGDPKVVADCVAPLSAERQVDLVVTEAATFVVDGAGLTLVEIADGYSADWIADRTGAPYRIDLAADRNPCCTAGQTS